MLVNRRVFAAKAGKGGEMTKILVDLFKHNPWPGGSVRIYTSHIGPFGHVVVETESENLATYEEANAQFEQNIPEELFENWHNLEDSGSTRCGPSLMSTVKGKDFVPSARLSLVS